MPLPWETPRPPPPPPPPEAAVAFSDLLTGLWILATLFAAAALSHLYAHYRRGGERRKMISRCLQRSYGLPALASLRREAITACAEMWLAFERRRAVAPPPSPEPRTPRGKTLQTVPEDETVGEAEREREVPLLKLPPPPIKPIEKPPPITFDDSVDHRLDDGGSALSEGEDSPSSRSAASGTGSPPAGRMLHWANEPATTAPSPRDALVIHAPGLIPSPPASPDALMTVTEPPAESPRPQSGAKSAPGSGRGKRRQIVVLGDAGAARSAVVERIGRMARKHGVDILVHEGIPKGCDALDAFHSQIDAALVVWDAALAEGRDQVQRHLSSLRPLRSGVARSFSLERLSEALLPDMPPPEEAAALGQPQQQHAALPSAPGKPAPRMRTFLLGERARQGRDEEASAFLKSLESQVNCSTGGEPMPAAVSCLAEAAKAAPHPGKPAWWPF